MSESEEKEVKTLLAYDMLSAEDRALDPVSMPQDFNQACQEAMTMLDEKVSHYLDRYGSAAKSVQERDTVALTIDHNKIILQLVFVLVRI